MSISGDNSVKVSEGQSVKEKGYKKLVVWKKSHQLVMMVYKYTKLFPRNEEYGLISQLRRSALSVPTNIVEGHASLSRKEFLSFLNIANRSLVETEYLLEVAQNLGYLRQEYFTELDSLRREVGYVLNGLIRSVRTSL